MIIAVNKWDAIEKNDKTINEFTKNVRLTLSTLKILSDIIILL